LASLARGGEVIELVKKHLHHGHPFDPELLQKELGDVLWYLAEMCSANSLSLEDVAKKNIAKLRARYPEGFSAQASLNRAPGDV
jgi:NTP pyrophosphatase (non-canonical NTP hydrolase)